MQKEPVELGVGRFKSLLEEYESNGFLVLKRGTKINLLFGLREEDLEGESVINYVDIDDTVTLVSDLQVIPEVIITDPGIVGSLKIISHEYIQVREYEEAEFEKKRKPRLFSFGKRELPSEPDYTTSNFIAEGLVEDFLFFHGLPNEYNERPVVSLVLDFAE